MKVIRSEDEISMMRTKLEKKLEEGSVCEQVYEDALLVFEWLSGESEHINFVYLDD